MFWNRFSSFPITRSRVPVSSDTTLPPLARKSWLCSLTSCLHLRSLGVAASLLNQVPAARPQLGDPRVDVAVVLPVAHEINSVQTRRVPKNGVGSFINFFWVIIAVIWLAAPTVSVSQKYADNLGERCCQAVCETGLA
jgi:hypothetical protein